jgi:preprotein translocase subunit SecE
MEIKKTQPQVTTATPTPTTAPAVSTRGFADYIAGVKAEFFKITWTSRDELIVYTQIVVVATFVMGLAVFFTDVLIRAGLSAIGGLIHFIFG